MNGAVSTSAQPRGSNGAAATGVSIDHQGNAQEGHTPRGHMAELIRCGSVQICVHVCATVCV